MLSAHTRVMLLGQYGPDNGKWRLTRYDLRTPEEREAEEAAEEEPGEEATCNGVGDHGTPTMGNPSGNPGDRPEGRNARTRLSSTDDACADTKNTTEPKTPNSAKSKKPEPKIVKLNKTTPKSQRQALARQMV